MHIKFLVTILHLALFALCKNSWAEHNTYVFWSSSEKSVTGYLSINKPTGEAYRPGDNIIDWRVSVNGQTLIPLNSGHFGETITITPTPNNPFGDTEREGPLDYSISLIGNINVIISGSEIAVLENGCSGSVLLCYEDSGSLLIPDLEWSLRPSPIPIRRH